MVFFLLTAGKMFIFVQMHENVLAVSPSAKLIAQIHLFRGGGADAAR